MELEVGSIVEGKVTGITKFGAFVALPGGKSGLVHISEVASAFVNDIHDFVQVGQEVKVRVIGVSPEGKISLSIKRAAENAPAQEREQPRRSFTPKPRPTGFAAPERTAADGPSADQDFEDRLKKFMQESDSRIADSRRYEQQRSRSRRR